MKNEKFLRVNDIVVEYTQNKEIVHAVNKVSFELEKGQTLALVGETGAGKTTIAKAILRILPDVGARFCSGEIWLDGKKISEIPEKEMLEIRGNKIAMIFQDPMTALNPLMTVGEQIMEVIGLHNKSWNHTKCQEEAAAMLEMVGIPAQRFDEYPFQFSGGMKQRVVIAMALACNPELLLADEPTTALDVTIQAQVLDLIRDLRDKLGTSMILITHDLGVVAETCDNVAIVYAGEIVEYGSKEEIFRHRFHPYTQGLFGSLPNMNINSARLTPIHGLPPDPTVVQEGCAFAPRCKYATEECFKTKPKMVHVGGTHKVLCIHPEERSGQNG